MDIQCESERESCLYSEVTFSHLMTFGKTNFYEAPDTSTVK